jgi:quinolinate synthetase A subunit
MDAPDADGLVPVIPVTYMNSSAAIKGFVGRHGGIVCTSSNARTVLEWAFQRGRRVLFFPDQHLGRNTAKAMGVPLEQMPMWNPRRPLGGASVEQIADARVILWHGFCSVHRRFSVDQIAKARVEHPGVRVIVHPECPMEVVDAADEDELHERIRAAKQILGDRVVVLGHFYQREEVVRHADYVGDSFQLANAALEHPDAEAIVFCGVHFMAETADLLSRPEQAVILPNLAAGCSMADMADIDQVEECWEQLAEVYGDMDHADADGLVPVIPVTYMNSSAAIKGFVGRHGGIVCTSSNARTVLEWAFERGRRVLFFPDQHLGRNTAKAMGVPLEQMPMWNPRKPLGGNEAATLLDAKVILWHGFC